MKKYLLILFSIVVFNLIEAQALIGGTVKDAISGEPIQHVGVVLSTTYKGTTTDENGSFLLEIPDYSDKNVFTFQLIGYQTKNVNLVELMRSDVIYLTVDEQKVNEVVVKPINAYNLIKQVVEKIPDNYYSNPIGQEVFYRQLLYTNNELSILEEGHFDMLNSFHRTRMPKAVTVQKSRGFVEMDQYKDLGKIVAKNIEDDSLYIENSALSILAFNPNLDDLTNDKTGIFGEKNEKYYDFNYAGLAIKNGYVMHIVKFDQKDDLKTTLYKGTLYIDTASKAVVEIEASLSPEGLDFQKLLPLRFRMLAKIGGYKIQIYGLSFTSKYKQNEGFWVVDEGSFTLDGSIAKRKQQALIGNLSFNFKVLDNYNKSDFYKRKTEFAVIPSNIESFKSKYFWGELNVPFLPQKANVLLQDLITN